MTVLLSHGMGPHYDGTHLLAEVLKRIDRADDAGAAGRARASCGRRSGPGPGCPRRARQRLAPGRRNLAAAPSPIAAAPLPAPRRTRRRSARGQRFYPNPNNFVYGGVRINLAGREPAGRVRPGPEFDAVCDRLRSDLLDVINVDTGRPMVDAVTRTDDHYRRRPDDRLPDLFIDWNRQSLVETVWSPKIGLVHVPYTHWRTGDHRPDGLLLARGAGIDPGAALPPVRMVDLAPSLAARLGVTLEDVDGRPAGWLAGGVSANR